MPERSKSPTVPGRSSGERLPQASISAIERAYVGDRLRQIGIDDPSETMRTVETLLGTPSQARLTNYRERRKQMLLALLDEYADDVDQAAEEIGGFFDRLRQVGVRGLVAERLNDGEYIGLPATPEP